MERIKETKLQKEGGDRCYQQRYADVQVSRPSRILIDKKKEERIDSDLYKVRQTFSQTG